MGAADLDVDTAVDGVEPDSPWQLLLGVVFFALVLMFTIPVMLVVEVLHLFGRDPLKLYVSCDEEAYSDASR